MDKLKDLVIALSIIVAVLIVEVIVIRVFGLEGLNESGIAIAVIGIFLYYKILQLHNRFRNFKERTGL